MKNFAFTIDRVGRRGDVYGTIYRIKNNVPVYVSEFEYRNGCTRGDIHEAFNKLMEIGEIPKKYYKSSVCAWRGAGYFDGDVTKHYNIFRLGR